MPRQPVLYIILLLVLCSCTQSKQQRDGTQKDSMVTIIDTIATDTVISQPPQTQVSSQKIVTATPKAKPTKQQERYDNVENAYNDGYAHGYQDGWDDGWHHVGYGLSFLVEPDYAGFKKHYEIGYTDGYADGYEEGEEEKDQ